MISLLFINNLNAIPMLKKTNNSLFKITEKLTYWIGTPQSVLLHTIFFSLFLASPFILKTDPDFTLSLLTNIVSLEAIYLAIFIQMSVNRSDASIDKIQEDMTDLSEDVEDIQKDIEQIGDDMDEIQEDMSQIQENLEEEIDEVEPPVLLESSKVKEDLENIKKDLALLNEKLVMLITKINDK
jgi:uncharacterized membrane protein